MIPPIEDPRPTAEVEAPPVPPPPLAPPKRSTLSKIFGLFVVVICFEIGVFLMAFPWMDAWGRNSLATLSPSMIDLWESNYFRGALSGLGLVNIWISFQEMLRLLRG